MSFSYSSQVLVTPIANITADQFPMDFLLSTKVYRNLDVSRSRSVFRTSHNPWALGEVLISRSELTSGKIIS